MSCGYVCTSPCPIPICRPHSRGACYPVGPIGSFSSCGSDGSFGFGAGSGFFGGSASGNAIPASVLGATAGVPTSCIVQNPPSVLAVKPNPEMAIMPGSVLLASGEPSSVAGNAACIGSSGGIGGFGGGLGGFGGGLGGFGGGLGGFGGGYGGFSGGLGCSYGGYGSYGSCKPC